MTNLNRLVLGTMIILGLTTPGFAGQAILFDDASLVGYRDDGRIYGFYDARNERFSCSFLFFQDGRESQSPNAQGYTDTDLFTFVPGNSSFEFSNRDKTFDIKGDLYRREDQWVIRTSTGQAGCENATGGFIFNLGSKEASRYHVTGEIRAIGIRLVKNKTLLYDYRGGRCLATKSYLTRWDAVVLLATRDRFSLVRYSDPRLNVRSYGRTTNGCVRSADLVDPFPLAEKHREFSDDRSHQSR
jgi:hypothetical protein